MSAAARPVLSALSFRARAWTPWAVFWADVAALEIALLLGLAVRYLAAPWLTAEIGPAKPIRHADPATEAAILQAADRDFVEGIRFSLGVAIIVLAFVFAAGFRWFPRGRGVLADIQREAGILEREESAGQGRKPPAPMGEPG